jgi:hypothetical protein
LGCPFICVTTTGGRGEHRNLLARRAWQAAENVNPHLAVWRAV